MQSVINFCHKKTQTFQTESCGKHTLLQASSTYLSPQTRICLKASGSSGAQLGRFARHLKNDVFMFVEHLKWHANRKHKYWTSHLTSHYPEISTFCFHWSNWGQKVVYVCVCREVAFRVCVSVCANMHVNANVNNGARGGSGGNWKWRTEWGNRAEKHAPP